ncbi:Transposable element Hobo transposase, partial [Frankliniella fusca]
TIAYTQEDAKGETIRATLLAALGELGISEEEVQNITFVTDNGSNIVKALEGFKRLYCMCNAMNICLGTGLGIRYHDLIINCLSKVPRAMQVVEACDDVVRYVKGLRGREAPRRLKDGLKKSKQHHSYSNMLVSLRTRLEEVLRFLESREEEERLHGVTAEELDDLLEFLAPLDYSAGREASSEVTLSAWPKLQAHASPAPAQEVAAEDGGDADGPAPPSSDMVTALRKQLQDELHLMELVEQVDLCKKLVRFLKQSDLSHRLSKTVKQDCEVRWNSTYTMLQSVDAVWDEIVILLGANNERMVGLNRATVGMLLQFLKPFLEESKKLEGEDYPTLPLALLSTCRLQKHCARTILPQSAEDEDQDVAAENLSFRLLRRNVLQQLGTTVTITMEHKLATVLHPTYRQLRMLPPGERNQEDQVPQPKRSKLDDGYDDNWACDVAGTTEDLGVGLDEVGSEEVDRYLRQASTTTHENLLKWWETEGAAYPNLQTIARQILAIPASSASSERVFSKAGFIINSRRTCLATKTVDALLFLQQHRSRSRKLD